MVTHTSKVVNRFLIRYSKLIEYCKEREANLDVFEKHHITPTCIGGTNDPNNIIKMSPKAHFIAHYLLCKAYPSNVKLKHAFAMMIVNNPNQYRRFTGKLYECAKIERSKALKGVPRPDWVKEKLRKPKSNKANYKKPKSEEHKLKISLAQKGRVHKTATCTKCGKTYAVMCISRWHNENCKVNA